MTSTPLPFPEHIVMTHELYGVTQMVWRFENNYGASLVSHEYSRGLELAVVRFPEGYDEYFVLDYGTGITDDVVSGLDLADVAPILERIKAL